MRCLKPTDKLWLITLLIIEILAILKLSEVQIVLEICRCDRSLLAITQGLYEERSHKKETIFCLKELDVAVCQIALVHLHGVFRGLALFD